MRDLIIAKKFQHFHESPDEIKRIGKNARKSRKVLLGRI